MTTFELKHRPCCKAIYRLPYYVKNMILLVMLMFVMIPTYLLHNKNSEVSTKLVERLMAGLTSEVFDFMNAHAEHDLKITSQLKNSNVNRL